MAINFPNSPSVNDQYTVGDRTWTWNGTYWQTSTSMSTFTASDSEPVDADAGDIWFDSTIGKTFINYSGTWVEIGNAATVVDVIADADADTKVQVESSADEDKIRFSTAGTERVIVDNAGNVGIGISSPASNLEVTGSGVGNLRVEGNVVGSNNDGYGLHLYGGTPDSTTNAGGRIFLGGGARGDDLVDAVVFYADTTERMRIDSSGNVGIGKQSPSELLDIDVGTSGSVSLTTSGGRTIQLTANDSDPFLSVGSTTAHSASIMTNGVRRIIVLDDGKVGIGKSTPLYLLDVNGDAQIAHSGTADLLVKTTNNSSNAASITIGGARTASSDDELSQLKFYNFANQSTGGDYEAARISAVDPSAAYTNGRGALVFKTSNGGTLSEHMRIDENGNVGIGTNSPADLLEVQGGGIVTTGYVQAGEGNGGVALTHNDGQGNANLTFNHVGGVPEQNGNSARIAVNTDSSTNANIAFEVKSGVTNGVSVNTTASLKVYETSVDVVGALSKGSGSFKIPHPILEGTHNLVHSFIEGPRADLIYRGKVTLTDGRATIKIDESAGMTEGTFVALNRDIQCWVTNDSGWTAVRGSVLGNILTIEAQDSSCTDAVSWLVIGERHDQHMYDTGWTDDDGRVVVEPEIVVEGDV